MITSVSSGAYLKRAVTWFNPSQDFTILFQFRYETTSTAFRQVRFFGTAAADFTNPYIDILNTASGVNDLYIDISDGVNPDYTSNPATVTPGTNSWVGIVYNSVTHQCSFYFNGSLVNTFACNLDLVTSIPYDFLFSDGTGGLQTELSIAYERLWQRTLSLGELVAEVASTTPVSTTSILSSCPLYVGGLYTDFNTPIRSFIATGVISTKTDDPLISLVLSGTPANTSAVLAEEITLPVVITQSSINLAPGATHPVWFKFTTSIRQYSISVLAYAQTGATYRPFVSLYDGPAASPTIVALAPTPGHDEAGILPTEVSTTYYLKIADDGFGTVFTAPLIVEIVPGPESVIPIGSILINDDTEGLRGYVQDLNTGVGLRYFPLVAGEQGTSLPTGEIALTADDEGDLNHLYIYNYQLQHLVTAALGVNWASNIAYSATKFFFTSSSGGNSTLHSVTVAGVVATVAGPIAGNINTICVNRDETILYYVLGTSAGTIRRWNITTNLVMTNLVVEAGLTIGFEMVYLADDTILADWSSSSTVFPIKRYNTAGALQNTYTITYGSAPTDSIRIQAWSDDPDSFITWSSFLTAGVRTSTIKRIRCSDGAVLVNNTTLPVFEQGLGIAGSGHDSDMPRFGNSKSCPLIVLRIASFPPVLAKSGLYTVSGTGPIDTNPIIRHDQDWIDTSAGTSEDVIIPDPYYDTFLAGDE